MNTTPERSPAKNMAYGRLDSPLYQPEQRAMAEATAFIRAVGIRNRAMAARLRDVKTTFESAAENYIESGCLAYGPDGDDELRNSQYRTAVDLGIALGNLDSVIETLGSAISHDEVERAKEC